MEFSYKISETEYLRAYKLWLKARRGRVFKSAMIWVIVVAGALLLFGVIQKGSQAPVDAEASTPLVWSTVVANVLPAFIPLSVFVFFVFFFPKIRLRRMYLKDPAMRGQITVEITPESFSFQNTSGISYKTVWSIYDYWREGKNLIVLSGRTCTYWPLCLAGLSAEQRAELNGILTAALPKR